MITRATYQLARNWLPIVLILVVVGLGLVTWAGHAYANPPMVEASAEEQEVYAIELTATDSAEVRSDTPLYEPGETLESKPAYFLNVSPVVDLAVAVDVPDDRETTLSSRLRLEERAVRDDRDVWSRDRVLEAEETTVTEAATFETSLDVSDLQAERAEIEAITDPVSTMETSFVVEVDYEIEAETDDGPSVHEGTLTVSPQLEETDNAYWISGDRSDEASETTTIQPEPEVGSPDMGVVTLRGLLGGGAIAGAAVLALWARRVDVDELELAVARDAYGEWISEGELLTDSTYRYVFVNSLEDLVNVGIDNDKRVIYDPDLDVYQVVDGEIIYYYTTTPSQIERWSHV